VSKVERAKQHLANLEMLLSQFLASTPYKVAAKPGSERRTIYYVSHVAPVPDAIPLVTGDAIQNLMSALDHLAYQLVCKDTLDKPPNPKWIYFPIADDEPQYELKKRGKMEGAEQATFDLIDQIKPYRDGNVLLWQLYRLNNIEKHRLLLTVGAQAGGIHLGHMVAPSLLAAGFSADAVAAFSESALFLQPADKGFPLAPGFELFHGPPDEPPNPKLQFRFVVVLKELGIVEGVPLTDAVTALLKAVESVVATLTPRLA
jgi:hypothetical protein